MEKTTQRHLKNDSLVNLDYYEGLHFKYWVGAMPSAQNPNRDKMIHELQRAFVSANFIRETIDRHVNALLGKPPTFNVIPNDQETPSETETASEKLLNRWFNLVTSEGSQEIDDDISPLVKAVTRAVVMGRGYLRLFTRKRFENSPDNIKKISLHSPASNQVEMIYDAEGSLEAIEYVLSDDRVERQELDPVTGVLKFYILKNKGTTKEKAEDTFELDLGFNWSIFEISCPPMITESIRQQQNSINLTLTMLGRNIVQAGFIERLLLNAQAPGKYVENLEGDYQFVPDPEGFAVGAGVTNIVTGIPIGDPRAPEGYTSPSAVFRQPVEVKTFADSLKIFIERLYNEMGQGHIMTQGDGGVSEVSRIQLTQDFKNTLTRQVNVIQSAFSNCFTTALIMLDLAGENTGVTPGNFSVAVKLNVDYHLLTPEEHNAIREDFKAGIISTHTTLQRLKVDDIPEELERLEEESQKRMESQQLTDSIQPTGQPAAQSNRPRLSAA